MKMLRKLFTAFEKKARKGILSGIFFAGKPVILTDKYGMRFVMYPSAHEPLEKLLSRRYLVSEYAAISKILKRGDIVFDIGANIGTHSVFMSKCISDKGKIYAFEPVDDTSWELRENLSLNRISNVEVIVGALSDRDGTETMNIFPSDFSAWNTFGVPDTNESKPIKKMDVKTIRLDTFIKEKGIDHINFIKIDAEGGEKKIFMGASECLRKGVIETLSFEVSTIPMKGMGGDAKDLFSILNSFGYNIYEFNVRDNKFIGPITSTEKQYENYYASKKDLRKI